MTKSKRPRQATGAANFLRRSPMGITSFNPETGTFTAVAATGTPVDRNDYFDGPYQEVLLITPKAIRMRRLQSGRAPLLNSHARGSASDQIGVITAARIE